MNGPNDVYSGTEAWVQGDAGRDQMHPVISDNYGFPTMEDSIIRAKEREEYGLDEKQLSRAVELGLNRDFIDEIEQRQIQGKKLLAGIDAMPKELFHILLDIFESIRLANNKEHRTPPKSLPKEWHTYIREFTERFFGHDNPYSMYGGNAFYASDIAMGMGYERILFLLNLWSLYPDILGTFYTSSQLLLGGNSFTGKPYPKVLEYLLVSTGGIRINTSYAPFPVIMNHADITVDMLLESFTDEDLGDELSRFIQHMDFTFIGNVNPKDLDTEYNWFLEALIIGGFLVKETTIIRPRRDGDDPHGISPEVLERFFYTHFRNNQENKSLKALLQKIFDQKKLGKIIDGYIRTAQSKVKKTNFINKNRSPHKSANTIKIGIEDSIQSGIFQLDRFNILTFTRPYTGDAILTIDKEQSHHINMKDGVANIQEIIDTLDIARDHLFDINITDTDTYRAVGDPILWKSPILEYLRTSSPALSGRERYAFERGKVTDGFFSSLENTHQYNEYIGVEIISPDGMKITENDLHIKNGKYEFRYFLKNNPEITSKSTYYTRNIKASPQVVSSIESNVIKVIGTSTKPTQEIIHPPTSVSQEQKSFEDSIFEALDRKNYTLQEMSDMLYKIDLADKIVITYDVEKGVFSLVSDSNIILSDDVYAFVYTDIIEPYIDTKEMRRRNEALEAKESQIKELKKIRNHCRRKLDSYKASDTEDSFDTRIDRMTRRDARGSITGYFGYSTIAFGQHTETLQELLTKTPGITLGIDKEQKTVLISFEQGPMRATIRSTKSTPYYEISSYGFDDDTRDIEQVFLDTLRYLYLLIGVMSTGEKKEDIYQSREGKNMILEAYKRLEKGEAKIELDSGWYHGGWYESKIEGKKGLDVLTGDDDIRIVLHDESIAVADKGGDGQKNVYERIRDNERLRKYLILRMVATIRDKKFKNKSPFDRTMKDEFLQVWNSLGEAHKKGFTDIFAHDEEGSTDIALIYEVDGENFFQKVLKSWEKAKVALVYRSPQTIGVDEFKGYIADMREKGELA